MRQSTFVNPFIVLNSHGFPSDYMPKMECIGPIYRQLGIHIWSCQNAN